MSETYTPKGKSFYDATSNRVVLLVSDDEPQESWRGWLVYRGVEGNWVSLRKATADDIAALEKAGSK